jgi:thiosulfate dehydrogenase [quinone] large subunit
MAISYLENAGSAVQEGRTAAHPSPEASVRAGRVWEALRLAMGWTFLWAFLDKTLALGFATGRDPETGVIDFLGPAAWIRGGHPTEGFLKFGTKGPFAAFFQTLAGATWVDWVYMLSMVAIGLGLILGIAVRPAAVGGIIWMGLFYVAGSIWPENNPFLDNHIVEAMVLAGIAYVGAGTWLGLGRYYRRLPVVAKRPLLY